MSLAVVRHDSPRVRIPAGAEERHEHNDEHSDQEETAEREQPPVGQPRPGTLVEAPVQGIGAGALAPLNA